MSIPVKMPDSLLGTFKAVHNALHPVEEKGSPEYEEDEDQ